MNLKDSNELPEFVKEIKVPSGIIFSSNLESSSLNGELEGDLIALSLIDLDKEGLSKYKSFLKKYEIMNNGKIAFQHTYPLSNYSEKSLKADTVKEILNDLVSDKEKNSLSIEEARKALLRVCEKMGRNYNEQDEEFLLNLDLNRVGIINNEKFNQAVLSYL